MVEGKIKKKSFKANVTSKFGAKRKKLSRIVKKRNVEFITRNAALKKLQRLQITLKDFKLLCILKGVYPTKVLNVKCKVYNDIKVISYIMNEPLLQKFREFKTFMKKIRKAVGIRQTDEARF
jgi:pescadillo protein